MADGDCQAGTRGELCQFDLPQVHPVTVGFTSIGRDE